eukprot:417010-Pleurochrysis_carterae.AAC.1
MPILKGSSGEGRESARMRWATSMAAAYAGVPWKPEGMRHAHARNRGRVCGAADTRWGLDASGETSQGTKKTGTGG